MSVNINSKAHASRVIVTLAEAGPIGDEGLPFLSTLSKHLGTPMNEKALRYVREAVIEGEREGKIFVVRDTTNGGIISIDKFDCNRASAKPSIATSALLPIVHDLLIGMSNDKGRIITRKSTDNLIDTLYKTLSEQYTVEHAQIADVFKAMGTLGLRDHSRMLVKTGMFVSPDRGYQQSCGHDAEINNLHAELRDLQERLDEVRNQREGLLSQLEKVTARNKFLTEENTGVMEENQQLTDENERLTQTANNLRQRSEKLSELQRGMRTLLDDSNKK